MFYQYVDVKDLLKLTVRVPHWIKGLGIIQAEREAQDSLRHRRERALCAMSPIAMSSLSLVVLAGAREPGAIPPIVVVLPVLAAALLFTALSLLGNFWNLPRVRITEDDQKKLGYMKRLLESPAYVDDQTLGDDEIAARSHILARLHLAGDQISSLEDSLVDARKKKDESLVHEARQKLVRADSGFDDCLFLYRQLGMVAPETTRGDFFNVKRPPVPRQ